MQPNLIEDLPAVELVGVFLASIVEIEAEICIDSDSKIVVHDKYLCVIFI